MREQFTLFEESLQTVVNVAKVPQLSPFRYPGGKTWLVPRIRRWMMSMKSKPQLFIEPFAGGGIISLTIAAENFADRIVMVELDDQIASVWKTILGKNWKWLVNEIASFEMTHHNLMDVIESPTTSVRDKAFQTVLKNRTYHGGILAAGSGILKNGENGKGIHSRWYPETLCKRITAIQRFKSKIEFIEGDGIQVMDDFKRLSNAVFFVDPPYTAGGKRAGRRLYRYFDLDHRRLFELTSSVKGDCLMTYDDAPEVMSLAREFGLEFKTISMQNTHLSTMNELLVGKNLGWLHTNKLPR